MMIDNSDCGLRSADGQSVPLTAVHISGDLLGNTARITVAQTYRNSTSTPMEAVYTFPLATGASVSSFEARIGERRVIGQVMESEEAFERYDDAMADGHGAFLLDQHRPNIFTASVGNLNVGDEAVIEISYVCVLEQEGNAIRFTLPTTISPRYVSASGPEVGQPDAERVNPPKALAVPYALTLDLKVKTLSPIASVESPSHSIRTELDDGSARVTLANRDATMDRDFVLLVEERAPNQPGMAIEERDGEYFAMLRMLPSLEDIPAAGPQEIHFVLDCSGSMGGTSIGEAVRALELCVRALSEGDRFNIIPFGTSYRMLWPEPRAYSQRTLDAAVAYVRACGANMGGTEILTPLKHILEQPSREGVLRKVLLLTDGQVSNEADVIRLAQTHRDRATIFSFGIGAGSSEHLVRGVAKASGGISEFIFPGERIEPKVLRTFGRVRAPSLAEPKVSWASEIEQAPARLSRLYPEDVLTVFARSSEPFAGELVLRAGERNWKIEAAGFTPVNAGTISTLWAKNHIADLESKTTRRGSNQRRSGADGERKLDRVITLSKKYGVLCGQTSFVAVDVRSESEKTEEQAQLRVVPIALTDGWGSGGRSRGFGRAGGVGVAAPFSMAPPSPMAPQPKTGRSRMSANALAAMAPQMQYAVAPGPPPAAAPRAGAKGAKRKSLRSMFKKAMTPSRPAVQQAMASASDSLYDVLLTQKANGSFALGAEISTLIGVENYAALEAAKGAQDATLLATSAVVFWLENRASERRGEWSAAVTKARGWLAKQAPIDIGSLLNH